MHRIASVFIVSFLIGSLAHAGERFEASKHYSSGDSYRAYARVVDVDPLVRRRLTDSPTQSCRWERPRHLTYPESERYRDAQPLAHRHHGVIPTIVGGLIGSLIGHQFGGGHGKQALTIAGAITGASIGNQIAHERGRWHREHARQEPLVQRCYTVSHTRVTEDIHGYRVTYRYNGETFTKIMDTHPGERVPIYVSVVPFE